MPETLVDLLRHGEPQGGVRFRGYRDDPLSATGWAQMRAATASAGGWDVVVASPLRRCAEFAAELAARHGLPVETEERLKEIGFGDWEGLTAEQISATAPDALAWFWRDPVAHTPPGAERLDVFAQRVVAGWNDLIERHAGKRVLLVCHGGVIRQIIAHVLSIPPRHLFRMQVPFAGASRIRASGRGAAAWTELIHLGGPM